MCLCVTHQCLCVFIYPRNAATICAKHLITKVAGLAGKKTQTKIICTPPARQYDFRFHRHINLNALLFLYSIKNRSNPEWTLRHFFFQPWNACRTCWTFIIAGQCFQSYLECYRVFLIDLKQLNIISAICTATLSIQTAEKWLRF